MFLLWCDFVSPNYFHRPRRSQSASPALLSGCLPSVSSRSYLCCAWRQPMWSWCVSSENSGEKKITIATRYKTSLGVSKHPGKATTYAALWWQNSPRSNLRNVIFHLMKWSTCLFAFSKKKIVLNRIMHEEKKYHEYVICKFRNEVCDKQNSD